MTCRAVAKLTHAEHRAGACISIGLEPAPEYLPPSFAASPASPTPAEYLAFFRILIDSTRSLAAAYKPNLAFFEALGSQGWDLLYEVRDLIPAEAAFIADAKRSDIGTTAAKYAHALYTELRADCATVNPLMGRDSVEPFLTYKDHITFCLVLTSNPGASDFLLSGEPTSLHLRIARKLVEWNTASNLGFVVGATRPSMVREVRDIGPTIPFLVPGVGAQGGEVDSVVAAGAAHHPPSWSGLVFHATRGILPTKSDAGDAADIIRAKTEAFTDQVRSAIAAARSKNATTQSTTTTAGAPARGR